MFRLAPLKKPLPKGAQAAGKGIAFTSPGGNAKIETRQGPPHQKQTTSNTNLKQQQRLPKVKVEPGIAIDLTLDDLDKEAPVKGCKEKIEPPIKSEAPKPKGLKRPLSPEISLGLTSTSLRFLDGMHGMDSGLGPRGGEPPSKRAKCEDGPENNHGAGMAECHSMESPLPITPFKSSTTAVDDPQSSTQPVLKEAYLPSIDTDLPPPADPRPVPHQPNHAASSPVPVQNDNHACADHTTTKVSTKPDQNIKPGNDSIEHKPPPTPCLAEKMKLAREFSAVMAVSERNAYQTLMKQAWDVDGAVLMHMELKEE